MAAALILASGSAARKALLTQAGLSFTAQPADIDEASILRDLQNKIGVEETARELAQRKALAVAAKNKGVLVIGGDQILSHGGRLYQKAKTVAEARENLRGLQGRTHHLISAVCVVRDEAVLWSHVESAQLSMKAMDDAAIARYAARAGDAVLQAVGGYELEGLGAWLFERIEGDYFTILGLPLLPLLGFLQTQGFGP